MSETEAPTPEAPERHASWPELFFDLVAVAGVSIVAHQLEDTLSWHHIGVLALAFTAFWILWASVTTYGNLLAMGGDDPIGPFRIFEGRCAEVDALRAGRERGGQRGIIAYPSRQLDVHAARRICDHSLDELVVVPTPKRCVKVDEMNPLGTLFDPLVGGIHGVAVVRFGSGLALGQANGLSVGDVDGRQQG